MVEALQGMIAGGGGRSFTVTGVYATMVETGTSWPRATVVKTMLRMTRAARRPPHLRLEKMSAVHYRLATL